MADRVTDNGHAGIFPYRALTVFIPFFIAAVLIVVLAVTLPEADFLLMLGLIAAYLLPPSGKEMVIPIGIALGIPFWYMALSIVMIDVITGLFMALNFDLAYRITYLGSLLSAFTRKTEQFILGHRWLAGLWFFSIVLMVMVPILGSGGIRGSVAGKLLGLSTPLTFLAILAGSLIGCFAIALGSEALLTYLCAGGMVPAGITARVCGGV